MPAGGAIVVVGIVVLVDGIVVLGGGLSSSVFVTVTIWSATGSKLSAELVSITESVKEVI